MASQQEGFLVFDEDFTDPLLSSTRWIPHYLPQWTVPSRSEARYILRDTVLQLQILADQPAWLPSDGNLRVSNIQTATYSMSEGSHRGTHRHRDDLVVKTAQQTCKLYTPSVPARVEARMRASDDPNVMLAFWLVGVEDGSSSDSGEICVVELFGNKTHATNERDGAELSLGVKAHHDSRLGDEMEKLVLSGFDAREWHMYAAEWDESEVRMYVDDDLVKTCRQHIGYELQLMIDLFEFPVASSRGDGDYPKWGEVSSVRGWRLS